MPPARSTVFALKCMMGTPLTRLDFNLALNVNEVNQLFYTVREGVHHVCLRLASAIPRTQLANALAEIERKPRSNFTRVDPAMPWRDYIHMGDGVRTGEGFAIVQIIRSDWSNGDAAFFQSLSTTRRHNTNLITSGMRQSAMLQPPPSPTHSLASDATLPLGESPPASPSNQTFFFGLGPNGAVLDQRMRLREAVLSAVGESLRIDPYFNLPDRLRELHTQMGQMTGTLNEIKAELAEMRQQ